MPDRNFRRMLEQRWEGDHFVGIGLDSDLAQIPEVVKAGECFAMNVMLHFNRDIVDATHDLVCAYKPNMAFYEAQGSEGISALRKTIEYIRKVAPEIPIILDAKRADIGNTNKGYLQAAFKYFGVDAITVHPYLGGEALQPFLDQPDKGILVLCRTSNPGAGEFQDLSVLQTMDRGDLISDGAHKVFSEYNYMPPLWAYVAARVATRWNENGNCGVVVGATYPKELAQIRAIIGDMPILIPGIGAQGGDVEETVKAGMDSRKQGMIINSSRGIIFASKEADFAEAARRETIKLRDMINQYRGVH